MWVFCMRFGNYGSFRKNTSTVVELFFLIFVSNEPFSLVGSSRESKPG